MSKVREVPSGEKIRAKRKVTKGVGLGEWKRGTKRERSIEERTVKKQEVRAEM